MKPYRKKPRPGNRAMNKEERARVDRVKRLGCIPCRIQGIERDDDAVCEVPVAEANHMKSGNLRIGHEATWAGCIWHHKGRLCVTGWTHAQHREVLGPSLAEGAVPFHAHFGTDAELLAEQERLLDGEAE